MDVIKWPESVTGLLGLLCSMQSVWLLYFLRKEHCNVPLHRKYTAWIINYTHTFIRDGYNVSLARMSKREKWCCWTLVRIEYKLTKPARTVRHLTYSKKNCKLFLECTPDLAISTFVLIWNYSLSNTSVPPRAWSFVLSFVLERW